MSFVSEKLHFLMIRLWQNRNSAMGNNCVSRPGALMPLLNSPLLTNMPQAFARNEARNLYRVW